MHFNLQKTCLLTEHGNGDLAVCVQVLSHLGELGLTAEHGLDTTQRSYHTFYLRGMVLRPKVRGWVGN